MSGKNKEKIMRTAADVREEMEAWRKKLKHAEERRCELLARWHSIDETKLGLLAEFVERIEDDIIWMGNEIALCECELMGREDYPSVACGDSSPDKGSQEGTEADKQGGRYMNWIGEWIRGSCPKKRPDCDSANAMAWAEPDKGSQGEAELCTRDTKADQEG